VANHVSALKRARQNQKRREVNRQKLTRVRHQIRELRRAMKANDKEAVKSLFPATVRVLDRAAQKGIIGKNTSARFKSRLSHHIAALTTQQA
jgi:small subunit ribosomal protein S20